MNVDFQVSPHRALNDQAVEIRADRLPPGARTTIRAHLVDDFGRAWEAHAIYAADGAGRVDVGSQAPLEGTYRKTDSMGLFWSMAPVDGRAVKGAIKNGLSPTMVTLTVEIGGEVVGDARIDRLFSVDAVERVPVRENGLVGTLFLPPGDGPFAGMVVLSGSGGGVEEGRAALLASHGFAAFALAYFFIEGLPQALVDIPLEYFERGLRWMAGRPEVRGERIGVMGQSRGGELVLLLGSLSSQIEAVVSYVPSHVIWGGFGPEREEAGDAPIAWTYRRKPLLPVPPAPGDEVVLDIAEGDPIPLTPYFLKALENKKAVERAAIAVERIEAPVLLISGGADAMWPSALMAARAMERMEERGHRYPHIHLTYPDAGHSIKPPYVPTTVTDMVHPVTGDLFALGGTAEGNARANEDSWQQILTFLDEHLRS